MDWTEVLSNLSNNNQSSFTNSTKIRNRVDVFTLLAFETKLVIVVPLMILGLVGFVGNILIHYYVSKRRISHGFLQSTPFVRNFNLYIKSLTLSDMVSSLVSVPLICIQLMFTAFTNGWPCRIVRYLGAVFPAITMNTFLIITVERFSSTRRVPRSSSVATVRKFVYGAWIVGFLVVMAPAATLDNVRYNVNTTHYTVSCETDLSYLPHRVIIICFTALQHFIPSIILTCINITTGRRIHKRQNARIDVQRDNAIKAKIRSAKIRGTYLLIFMTLAFIIPLSFLFYYRIYISLTKPPLDFRTTLVTRLAGSVLFFSSGSINFIIYLAQMKDFRLFLTKRFFCDCNANVYEISPNNNNRNVSGDEGIQLHAFVIPNNPPN